MAHFEEIAKQIEALGDPGRRDDARARLLALGEAAVEPLLHALQTETGPCSWAAAELLGKLGDRRAVPALVEATRSPSLVLSNVAVQSLLRFNDPELIPHLLGVLPDAKMMTQQSIVLGLQRLGDRRVVPTLLELLPGAESPTLRLAILQTLGKLGDPSAIPAVRALAQDPDHHVREWVPVILEQLGDA